MDVLRISKRVASRVSTSTENQGSPKSQLPIASPLSSDIGDRNGTETEVVIERDVGEGGGLMGRKAARYRWLMKTWWIRNWKETARRQ